jgi:hypothetical protein
MVASPRSLEARHALERPSRARAMPAIVRESCSSRPEKWRSQNTTTGSSGRAREHIRERMMSSSSPWITIVSAARRRRQCARRSD